jgi:DNA-binding SARP family transcriptional activator/TolB-like protein
MQPGFRLQTFGGLTLLRDGVPVSGTLSQRKRLALLAVLAVTPNGVARETVIALLWPESDEERGRNSLAQAVHGLRREIGESVVGGTNGILSLDLSCLSCDAAEFRSAVADGDHERAVELYRGPFLDGLYLREAPEFERWCDGQRADRARSYVTSLQVLAERAAGRGEWSDAVNWWRRCAGADPLSGRIARSYMEALAADGKREDAIRHADVYSELVRAELGAEPDTRVAALAEELRTAADRHERLSSVPTPAAPRPAPNDGDVRAKPASGNAPVATTGTRPPSRFLPRITSRPVRYIAIGLGVVAAVAAVHLTRQPEFIDRRVVVAAFENRTGDSSLDQLGVMAADLIAQGLQRTTLMDVVDPATALRASQKTRGERVPLGGATEARAIGAETQARLVVTGSYYRDGDTLVMAARVSDARDEKLLDALGPARVLSSASGSAVDLVRERVMGALAMRLDERLDPIIPPGSSAPPTYAAYLAFMQGLEAHQRQDRKAAAAFYAQAIANDSTFVLPHVWKVWLLGVNSPAGDSAWKYLASKRERLASLDRLAIDYQMASARRDTRAKIAFADEALKLAPGSHWAHNLGGTLTDVGRLPEAVAAFDQIDRRKGWTRGWLPYWERFSVALHISGDHARELELARDARRALPASSWPVYFEARALAAAGRVNELEPVLKQLAAYKENADSLGSLLSLLAREIEMSGDTIAARRLHDRAVSWFATLTPEQRMLPAYQLQLGIALYRGSRYAEAKPIFEGLVNDPTRNKRIPNFDPHGYLGGVYAYLGDKQRADSVIRVLLRDVPAVGQNPAIQWAARISAAMGEKDRAVAYLREQVARGGRGGVTHYDNRDLDVLFRYPPYLALTAMQDKSVTPILSIQERSRRPQHAPPR